MLRTPATQTFTVPIPAGDPLLDTAGPLAGARVLVIGHDALETMCALIRRGCAAATEMRFGDTLSPEPDSADAVLVPRVASAADAADAIARAARALTMGGRIVLRDVSFGLRQTVATLLRIHGFSAMRARMTRAGTVITAERPMHGPLPRA
jgi:hypothetical protein